MATTFDTEPEAQAVAAGLNAAAGRESHVRYQVEQYREKWAMARQSVRTSYGYIGVYTIKDFVLDDSVWRAGFLGAA